ncbi:MarR family transcriptional regulator [Streptosporangium sp. NPDC002524]|uniref:MarR family winged helix-turn-helix transcriptional regulator n=1 Tax=Streptosporangium sp. NPDC002524 TaxID=3154537 RepID=UPI003330203B
MTTTGQPIAATAPGREAAPESRCAGAHLDIAVGLVQLTGLVQGMYARVSERHGLTPVQAKLLCVLLDGPRGMAELAHCFGVEKAALTGLTDRAERRGLARRSAVPGDRRALQVTLTDTGHQAALAFHAEVTAELTRLLSPLSPGGREHFRAAMAEIITEHRAASSRDE